MPLNLRQPRDFDTELIAMVQSGDSRIHTLDYKRWERLPVNLKQRYYALTRHHTGGYRLYPQFMTPRHDRDPNTKVYTQNQLMQKSVTLPIQRTGDKVNALPYKPVVSTHPTTKGTDIERKSYSQIARETRAILRKPVGVTTRYSRF